MNFWVPKRDKKKLRTSDRLYVVMKELALWGSLCDRSGEKPCAQTPYREHRSACICRHGLAYQSLCYRSENLRTKLLRDRSTQIFCEDS